MTPQQSDREKAREFSEQELKQADKILDGLRRMGGHWTRRREFIAQALAVERERCAEIAESLCYCRDINHVEIKDSKNCPVAKSIANSIRSGRG